MAPDRPRALGARALVFAAILLAGLWAAWSLGLLANGPSIGEAGWQTVGDFFGRAFTPATRSEAPPPFGGVSILPDVIDGIRGTIVFAAAAVGLAAVFGVLLGFLGSTAWWSGDAGGGRSRVGRVLRRAVLPVVYGATRVLIAALRSTHELIWAILFLIALGRGELAAVIAIAIPTSGTIAKLVSEMIDEAPRNAAIALRGAGATPLQVFAVGLFPQAFSDIASALFYQLECGLRSAAILGFFGYPTLGYHIKSSFENLRYGEVWTHLYALLALILIVEWWSGAIRKRLER